MLDQIFEQPLLRTIDKTETLTCSGDIPISEVIHLMQSKRSGHMIIMNRSTIEGIFTERDYLFKIASHEKDLLSRPVSEFMVRNPVKVSIHRNIKEGLVYMRVGNFRTLVLVDEHDKLYGVVTMKDLCYYITDRAGFQSGAL